jgi:hypothetical protein
MLSISVRKGRVYHSLDRHLELNSLISLRGRSNVGIGYDDFVSGGLLDQRALTEKGGHGSCRKR